MNKLKAFINSQLDTPAVEPLVSVIAIAYNQSEWVIEALNSVFNQDYTNIELIISDDGSDDGTPELVDRWLKQHGNRFHGVRLLTISSNEGICRNVAKGVAAASGSWIKGVACDDILCEDAISKFIEQTQRDGTELVFSQVTKFRTDGGKLQALGNLVTNEIEIASFKQSCALLEAIRRENFLPAPSAFYSRRLLEAVGGIYTSFRHLDDWPLWLRMLPVISSVSWIDKPLVLYRISEKSVSQRRIEKPIGAGLYFDVQRLYREYQLPFVTGFGRWHLRLQNVRRKLVFEYLGNTWFAYRLLMPLQLLSPLAWKSAVKHLRCRLKNWCKNLAQLSSKV